MILYELLTGELPYDRDDLEREGVTRAITERPPRRPSRVNRTVRGDLELIVLKALEKDPARRYQSAAALAEDLERLATGRAVLARPPAVAYQLRKWTWRHRVACAYVGTLVALAVPAAVALSQVYAEARQMRIDEQQRKAAVARWYLQERVRARELRMAQQAQAFWEKTMADIGSNRPGISAVQLLDRAAARVGSELNDTPDTAAAVHTALADAYKRLERLPEAEGHLRAAVDRWKNAKPPDALKHAEALERLAGFLIERERWADAEQVLASELDLLAQPQRPVVGEESGPAEAERLAQASALLAQCLVPQGRFEEAEALLLRSLAELRRLYAEGDPRALRVVGLLVDLNQRWDRPEEAARWQARLQAAAPEDGPAPPP